jgi:hypothetical protein
VWRRGNVEVAAAEYVRDEALLRPGLGAPEGAGCTGNPPFGSMSKCIIGKAATGAMFAATKGAEAKGKATFPRKIAVVAYTSAPARVSVSATYTCEASPYPGNVTTAFHLSDARTYPMKYYRGHNIEKSPTNESGSWAIVYGSDFSAYPAHDSCAFIVQATASAAQLVSLRLRVLAFKRTPPSGATDTQKAEAYQDGRRCAARGADRRPRDHRRVYALGGQEVRG